MKKALLTVMALIVLVGTMFAPSSAWSFTPDNEACFLSDYQDTGGNPLRFITPTLSNQNLTALQTDNIFEEDILNVISPVAAVRSELGVSISRDSCSNWHTADPNYDITGNGLAQKRVDILLL